MRVSSYRRCVVICCHPVAILRAVFCFKCSLLMFVSKAGGEHMVETYSIMGLLMALYEASIVSSCVPHVVDASAFSICIVLRVFVDVLSICVLHLSLGSIVSPNIFKLMLMGCVVYCICSANSVLYYFRSGMKIVHAFLSGLRMRWFVYVHVYIFCRYD